MTINGQSRRSQILSRAPGGDPRARRAAGNLVDSDNALAHPVGTDAAGRTTLVGGRLGQQLRWGPTGATWVMPMFPTPLRTMNCAANLWEIVLCDPSTTAFYVTLPPSPGDGTVIVVKNYSFSTNVITIFPHGVDTIDKVDSRTIEDAMGQFDLRAVPGGWISTYTVPDLSGLQGQWDFSDEDNVGQAMQIWD